MLACLLACMLACFSLALLADLACLKSVVDMQYMVVCQCIIAEANTMAFFVDGSSMSILQVGCVWCDPALIQPYLALIQPYLALIQPCA